MTMIILYSQDPQRQEKLSCVVKPPTTPKQLWACRRLVPSVLDDFSRDQPENSECSQTNIAIDHCRYMHDWETGE